VSNYRITYNGNDKFINIPVEIKFDMVGRDEGVDVIQEEIKKQATNRITDFEVTRFSHSNWDNDVNKSEINYQFNFFNFQGQTDFLINPPQQNQWLDDYQYAGFLDEEIYYFANSFKKSFFKMDFYDKKGSENQKILFTVILPTQQGIKEPGILFNNPNLQVQVKKPYMILDYIGSDKEGFFLYWLKNQSYISQNEMYMSCKFFNAKTGQFVRMMNKPQSDFTGPDVYDFNKELYFYYKVVMDYDNFDYKVFLEQQITQQVLIPLRVGEGTTNPIKWYEYVNPI
jgi:hypothetical protein